MAPCAGQLESRVLLTTLAPFQNHIWATGSGLHETDSSFSIGMADYNSDGRQDMYAVKKSGTGSGKTEFFVYSGADGFDATVRGGAVPFIHAGPTALNQITDPHFQFRVATWDGTVPDLIAIDRSGPSGFVEVYVMRGEDNLATAAHYTTVLPGEGLNWDIDLADYNNDGLQDLVGVKRNGANSTEVHIATGAVQSGSRYQSYLLQTGTALHPTNADFSFLAEDMNGDNAVDIVAVQGANTKSGKTEVHVLNGAGAPFSQFSANIATGLHTTGSSFEFSIADFSAIYADGGGSLAADGTKDLVAFSKSNTGSNSTEVHVFSGESVALQEGATVPLPAGSTVGNISSGGTVHLSTSQGPQTIIGDVSGTNVTITGTGTASTGDISAQQLAIEVEMSLRQGSTISAPSGMQVSETGFVNILGGVDAATPVTVLGDVGGTGSVLGPMTVGPTSYQTGQAAIFIPGQSPGQFSVGDLTMNAGAELRVEIQGSSPGTTYDQVRILNTVTLNSPRLVLLDTFAAPAGAEFTIIRNDGSQAVSGTFLDSSGNPLPDGAVVDTNLGGSGRTARISYRGGDGNDVVIVVDGNYTFTSPVNAATSNLRVVRNNDMVEFYVEGALTRRRLTAGLSQLIVQGETGQVDALTVDFASGNPIPAGGISASFGTDSSDTIKLQGASANSVTHNISLASESSIAVNLGSVTSTINYGKSWTVTDSLAAATRTVTYDGAGHTVTIANSGTAGVTRLSRSGRTLNLTNPTSHLVVQSGSGTDSVTVSSLGSGFVAGLTINTGSGTDVVTLNPDLTLPSVQVTSAAISLNTAKVVTTGVQVYNGAVTLQKNAILNAGALTFGGAVNGPFNLTLGVTGQTIFAGALGAVTAVGNSSSAAILVNSPGPTDFLGTVRTASALVQSPTAGRVLFRDDVTITAATVDSIFNGSVVLDGLTFKTPRSVLFGDAVSDRVTLSSGLVTFDVAAGLANFNSVITGSQGFTKSGAGQMKLNASNTYSGPTTIQAGQLLRSASEQLPNGTLLTIGSGVAFDMQNLSESVGGLSGPGSVLLGSALLTVTDGLGGNLSGAISGTGSFKKRGTGSQTLSAENIYTGTTAVEGGTLVVSGKIGTTTPAGLVTVLAGATLNATNLINARVRGVAGSNIVTGGAAILGLANNTLGFETLGNLTVNSGTVQLLDANTVTLGLNTTINGGALSVARAFSVTSGQTLFGFGTVTAGTGTIGFTGATLNPMGALSLSTFQMDSTSTFAVHVGTSKVVASGTVTLNNPTLNSTLITTAVDGQDYVVIDNDGTDAIVGTFSGLVQGTQFSYGPERFARSFYYSNTPAVANDFVVRPHKYLATTTRTLLSGQLQYKDNVYFASNSSGQAVYVNWLGQQDVHDVRIQLCGPQGVQTKVFYLDHTGFDGIYSATPMMKENGDFVLAVAGQWSELSYANGLRFYSFDSNGMLLKQSRAIAVNSTFSRLSSVMMNDGSGVVVTQESSSDGNKSRIAFLRFDANLVPITTSPVAVTPFYTQAQAELWDWSVNSNKHGDFVIGWDQRIGIDGGGYWRFRNFARRYSSEGTAIDASPLVLTNQSGLYNSSDGLALGLRSDRGLLHAFFKHTDGGLGDIVIQRLNPDGTLHSERMTNPAGTSSYGGNGLAMSLNFHDEYVVASDLNTFTAWDQYVQKFSADDIPITSPIKVGSFNDFGGGETIVDVRQDGSFTLLWSRGLPSGDAEVVTTSFGEPQDVVSNSLAIGASNTLQFKYDIRSGNAGPLALKFYKSADPFVDATDQVLASFDLTAAADINKGTHSKAYPLGSGAGQVPIPGLGLPAKNVDYYLIAMLDPDDLMFELDQETSALDNQARLYFRFNDNPVIGSVPASFNYTENAAATPVGPVAVVTDADSSQAGYTDFNGGTLTLTLASGGSADDRLEFPNQGSGVGQIGKSGTTVKFGGIAIGTLAGGTGTTPLTFSFNTSAATPVAVQALLRVITFRTPGEDPLAGPRVLNVTLTDGDGGTGTSSTTINVIAVNDKPVLGGISGTFSYARNSTTGVILASFATVTDADHSLWTGGSLRIRISTGAGTSNRIVVGTGFSVDSSNVVFNGTLAIGTLNAGGGTGTTDLVITFNSKATTTIVRNLIRSIRFKTVAGTTGNRRVHFQLTDPAAGLSNDISVVVSVF